ncbi:MAG: tyrosine--tRNA ligase [Desulfurococcales archaeon ex4484_217_2]|nr:MAG: tyrosine--tRNA ligase [Desulfurococcales archaeon ex4484_217_2]
MDVEGKLRLITRNVSEVVTLDELKVKIESGVKLRAYLGFEPSGLFHIGWIVWANKFKDFIKADVETILLEATWHAMINDKLGGVMENIRKCAKYVEHSLRALGVDMDKVKVVDAEDLASDKDYWMLVIKVAKNASLARVKRALTIMGRREDEAELDFSKLIYPPMQVADIFYLKVNIALGGMDQRKAHMLARDVAEKLKIEKPIAIHTPLLTGLQGIQRMETSEASILSAKMSKSKPYSAIFIHDSPDEIRSKIRKAYCPPKVVENNPVVEIAKYILFVKENFVLHIERPPKYGGPLDIYSYDELEKLYKEGKLHPLDLKNAVAEALIKYLEPVRKYFEINKEAHELLNFMLKTRITR